MAARKTSKDKPNHNKEFFEALRLMEEERGIPREFIADKIAEAIVVAARKDYGGNDIVSCVIDAEKEIFSVTARKTIVDEVTDPYTEISKEDAAAIDPASVERGFIDIKLDPRKFGRVVAQNSKNKFPPGRARGGKRTGACGVPEP